MTSLDGLNALVCGSTQGIGRACAEVMAAAGARVTLMARDEQRLREVCDGLARPGGQEHGCLVADFSDWEAVRSIVEEHAASQAVHILVNNTGGPPGGPAADAKPEEYLDAFRKHLMCNQVLVQAVVPSMRRAEYGRIINIISTSVIMPIRGLGVSNTIRGAVANWGRILAAELGPDGITVNNILPGFTDTQRLTSLFEAKAQRTGRTLEDVRRDAVAGIPAGRLGRAEEIGAVAGFLASPAAAYVNGVNLPVDGGRMAAG